MSCVHRLHAALVLLLALLNTSAPTAAAAHGSIDKHNDGRRLLAAAAAAKAPPCATRLTTCTGSLATAQKQLRSCNTNVASARAQVAKLAPSGKKLASCTKNSAVLAGRLAGKTKSLDACFASVATLSRRLRTTRTAGTSRAVAAALADGGDCPAALDAAQARIADLEAALAAAEARMSRLEGALADADAELEGAYTQLSEAQAEIYALRDEGVGYNEDLNTCLTTQAALQTKLAVCTEGLGISKRAEAGCNQTLADSEAAYSQLEGEFSATEAAKVGADNDLAACQDELQATVADRKACDTVASTCHELEADLRQQLGSTQAALSNATISSVSFQNQLIQCRQANATGWQAARESDRQLGDCESSKEQLLRTCNQ